MRSKKPQNVRGANNGNVRPANNQWTHNGEFVDTLAIICEHIDQLAYGFISQAGDAHNFLVQHGQQSRT